MLIIDCGKNLLKNSIEKRFSESLSKKSFHVLPKNACIDLNLRKRLNILDEPKSSKAQSLSSAVCCKLK